jgi:voltage-gated sodium channel
MSAHTGPRELAGRWIESAPVQRFIIALILINAVILGLETSGRVMAVAGGALKLADRLILAVFVVEILIKFYAQRLGFFRRPWNVFDFIVVGIALVPTSGPFSVLRVLRLLRLVSLVPKLRFIAEALLKAVPGITSIFALLLLMFYVFAVIATGLFGEDFPDWFGSLGGSMYTLFQVMTLESWSMGIARPVMELHPYAWVFFVPFILLATFTVLNLFIAVIVNTMQTLHQDQHESEVAQIEGIVQEEHASLHRDLLSVRDENRRLHEDLVALRQEIRGLRERLERDG